MRKFAAEAACAPRGGQGKDGDRAVHGDPDDAPRAAGRGKMETGLSMVTLMMRLARRAGERVIGGKV